MERGEPKKERARSEEWVRKGEMDCCDLNFFFLSNFMVAKDLFDENKKCLFCGEFCDDDE